MCSTPYCYGDCEDCIADKQREQEYEERIRNYCPFTEQFIIGIECGLQYSSTKQDVCSKCGYIVNY